MQVPVRAVSAFQAGHEGSIPFARSNQKPQVTALTTWQELCPDRLNDPCRATHVPHSGLVMRCLAVLLDERGCADPAGQVAERDCDGLVTVPSGVLVDERGPRTGCPAELSIP
jgi:hypothetical protein